MTVSMDQSIAKTATEALRVLWEGKFFSNWKLKAAVEGELAKRGNHFNGAELGMALKRATFLTRKGKRGSYQYIQKHPYVPDTPKKDGAPKG